MKMSGFQIISLCVFAAMILIGIGVFATFNKVDTSNQVGKVVIWGTLDTSTMEQALGAVKTQDNSMSRVTYVLKNAKTYVPDLVDAMASGKGPDLFLISQDQITSFSNKIGVIPYTAITQQVFNDSYIDEAQMFLTPDGILALPYMVDPIVMYYNRDTLSTTGYANPPKYWNDFLEMAPKLTQQSGGSVIKRSAVALGGWSNVLYAKDILATMFMQAGDPIVVRDAKGVPTPVLGNVQSTNPDSAENPSASALQFYSEFANPTKTTYSWNRSLPLSQDAFVAGDLAIYFGFASDYPTLLSRNPNLHIGVAQIPQIENAGVNMTFGQMTAIAIPRTTTNPIGAMLAAQKLTNISGIKAIASFSNLPPVRRDIKVDTSKDASQSVFAQSALIARGWLDPDPAKTDDMFRDMIESMLSSSAQSGQAVYSAYQVLQVLLHTNSIQLPQ